MVLSLALALAYPAIADAKRRAIAAGKQALVADSSPKEASTFGVRSDPVAPIRIETRKLAELLEFYGLPAEEAADIALNKLPGHAKWWRSNLLPRFNESQRLAIQNQLDRFASVGRDRSESTLRAEFDERVMIRGLQQELKLSNTECFAMWLVGLPNQPEDWWSSQTARVSPETQRLINDFRENLGSPPPPQPKRKPETQSAIFPPPSTSPASQLVRGHDLAYSITLPPKWTFKLRSNDYDVIASYKSLYVGIIAEEAQLGTPETIANISRQKIKASATTLKWSEPTSLILDGRKWSQFIVIAHVDSIPAAYQFYVYSGPEGTFQIIGYTSQNLFERDTPLMRQVMQTFKFPK